MCAIFDREILAFNEAMTAQFLEERHGHIARCTRCTKQATQTICPPRLLRHRRERPCDTRAHEREELAPPHRFPRHSITLSARATSVAGTVTPIALAVLRLITSSNLLACSTGKSFGRAPLRMRSM